MKKKKNNNRTLNNPKITLQNFKYFILATSSYKRFTEKSKGIDVFLWMERNN